MTFTILGRDDTYFGGATCSAMPAISNFVLHGKYDLGIMTFQAKVSPSYSNIILNDLSAGKTFDESIKNLKKLDVYFDKRQIAFVPLTGDIKIYPGKETAPFTGYLTSKNSVCIGNMLADETTLLEMLRFFEMNSNDFLGDRLIESLHAGHLTKGDKRGRESAGIKVFHKNKNFPVIDLRVDHSDNPVEDLTKIYHYFKKGFYKLIESFPDNQGNFTPIENNPELSSIVEEYSNPVSQRTFLNFNHFSS